MTVRDRNEILRHLEDADIVPLTMSLIQMTGDESLLAEIAAYVKGPWDYSETVPDEIKVRMRARMAGELQRLRAGGLPKLPRIPPDLFQRMLSVAAGAPVAQEYIPLVMDQIGFDAPTDSKEWRLPPSRRLSAIVVGAGASGICAAVKLKQSGIPITVFEKNPDVGGTWYHNRYPGCAVDTPNHFYQFSFEPSSEWPYYFSKREHNLRYLKHVAAKYGIISDIRFNSEVVSADYDEAHCRWRLQVRSQRGETRVEADILIFAVGQLNRPAIPQIEGIEKFAGEIVHTMDWNDATKVQGKRVGLIGTGASGVQVGPAIAPDVAHLTIFQRSGSWIVRSPNVHRAVSAHKKWVLDNIPFYVCWYRFQLFWGFADGVFPALRTDPAWRDGDRSINALNMRFREAMIRHMKRELGDRDDLFGKALPTYPPYGKRVLADPGWFRMLRRDNVELVTGAIQRIESQGVRLQDGSLVELDSLILATGFQASKMLWPIDIKGRSAITIREVWRDDDPRAYMGIVIPNFPNLFVLYGPNTGLGHGGSAIFLAECQVRYILGCIHTMVERGMDEIECKQSTHDSYNEKIDAELKNFVWSHPSVSSWYKNRKGRIVINQPWRLLDYWKMTQDPNPDDFTFQSHRENHTRTGTEAVEAGPT